MERFIYNSFMYNYYMERKKIKFMDLSIPLRIAAILAWIVGMIYIFAFIVGFIYGG
jgi:hypothetical protein